MADRERRHRARRHLEDPVRHGHLRLALARRRRHRDRQGAATRSSTRARRSPRTCWRPSEGDVEFDNGKFTVTGTDKQKAFGEVAFAAYVPHNYPLDKLEPGLNENAFYDPTNFTFPAGCYVCEVEIDPDTGVDQDRQLHRGRRLRQDHQSDDRRGPGARRPHAGHRPGADRRLRLRPDDRPARHRLAHGLLHAARRRRAAPSRSTRTRRRAPTTRSA